MKSLKRMIYLIIFLILFLDLLIVTFGGTVMLMHEGKWLLGVLLTLPVLFIIANQQIMSDLMDEFLQ